MRVLVTGANGMVARAVVRYCLAIGDDVAALNRQELYISDREDVNTAFRRIAPEILINCAAYTDVDGAESNGDAAYKANAEGVANLAEVCANRGVTFVTISTDYVFDGAIDGFYTPRDVPNPQGVYAKSKFEGELRATAANPNAIIVRSGWIYGRSGTNFLSVMHTLLAAGKSVKAICDSYGTPTYADDLAKGLRELASCHASGVFHLANTGDGTSYLGFAERVCEIGGFDPQLIEAVNNDDLKRPAPRPKNSKLIAGEAVDGLTTMPDWGNALRRFIENQAK